MIWLKDTASIEKMNKRVYYNAGKATSLLFFGILTFGLLAACSPLSTDGPVEITAEVPAALDPIGDGLPVTSSPACKIADFSVIQTDLDQGDLVAWAPEELTIAFIAPIGRSWGWYEGDLFLYNLINNEEQSTRDLKVSGDLTWSPDGRRIAMVVFRLPESRYTVMVMDIGSGQMTDLYGVSAATDEFSSRKGIISWTNNQTLRVAENCCVDCVRIVDHDVSQGIARDVETIRHNQDTSLHITLNQPGISPNPNWFNANWSPDESLVFFTDRNETAWVADLAREVRFPLDSAIRGPQESKWSFDSRYLAVRTPEAVYLYDTICP